MYRDSRIRPHTLSLRAVVRCRKKTRCQFYVARCVRREACCAQRVCILAKHNMLHVDFMFLDIEGEEICSLKWFPFHKHRAETPETTNYQVFHIKAIYVSSYYYIGVLILLYMCPHPILCMCPHTLLYIGLGAQTPRDCELLTPLRRPLRIGSSIS